MKQPQIHPLMQQIQNELDSQTEELSTFVETQFKDKPGLKDSLEFLRDSSALLPIPVRARERAVMVTAMLIGYRMGEYDILHKQSAQDTVEECLKNLKR